MNYNRRIDHTKARVRMEQKLLTTLLIATSVLIAQNRAALAENAASKAQADLGTLVFSELKKKVILEIGETSKGTTFEFTNRGPKPIRIVEIKSSCGCTVPELEKKEYGPGEVGALNVEFKASSGVRNTSGTVLLVSDEGENNLYTLKVVASRKQAAVLSSQREEWKVGTPPEEREILVSIMENGTHIIEASTTNDAFDVKLATLEPGKEYKITVKPRASDYPAAAALRLHTTHEKQPFLTARLEIK